MAANMESEQRRVYGKRGTEHAGMILRRSVKQGNSWGKFGSWWEF